MNVKVLWQSYHEETPVRGYWDQGMLEAVFNRSLWLPQEAIEFEHVENHGPMPKDFYNGVVIIPARYHANDIDQINDDLSKLNWVLLILLGDEESVFPVEKIKHPRKMIYLMTPHAGKKYDNVDRFIGEGWPPAIRESLERDITKLPENSWFFTGQITHKRREECYKILKKMPNGDLIKTSSFADQSKQGIGHKEYYERMRNAKIVPCPSGPETPDTFRFYEALELGCVPIADAIATNNINEGYWNMLFGDELPFPIIKDWKDLKGHVEYHSDVFPATNNKVFAWWQQYKREFVYNLDDDIRYLAQVQGNPWSSKDDLITVLVPTSPIKSNPSTKILEETISTIRHHLPNSEIILTFDGVREEQEDRRANYEEFKRRVLYLCNSVWRNVLPLLFDRHMHQSGMARAALKYIRTPLILYVEHDTPLTPDMEIPWWEFINIINSKEAKVIRLHFEAHIPKEHEHMMLSPVQNLNGVPMIPTAQWSQRPHLATTQFYQWMLDTFFTARATTFIEDKMHGVLHNAVISRGKAGWNKFKVWIYAPEGNMKRSYHIDGREDDPKFTMTF